MWTESRFRSGSVFTITRIGNPGSCVPMRSVTQRLRELVFARLKALCSAPNSTDIRTVRISTQLALAKELVKQYGTFLRHNGALRTLSYISWSE